MSQPAPTFDTAAQTICHIGAVLYQRGFVAANEGNISSRLDTGLIACTPTGVSKGFMNPGDLCQVDLLGHQHAGDSRVSSEVKLHLTIYRNCPWVNAVVHCHPPHSTAYALTHSTVPTGLLPEMELRLGPVPITKYETPGTQIFADSVLPFVQHSSSIILANHGTVHLNDNLKDAWFDCELLDQYCRVLLLAMPLGPPKALPPEKVEEVLDMKRKLGMRDPRFQNEE